MSDRFPAQIWIGGKVSKAARLYPDEPDNKTTILDGLIGALNADGASHEYGDKPILENCTDTLILYSEYLDDDSLLHLKHDAAVNGELTETEQFCIDHNIPFDRWSDHYCEYDGENVYWRPGMKSPLVTIADSNGNEIVDGEIVRKGLEFIEKFQKNYGPSDDPSDWEDLATGISLLRGVCPKLPPKLECFEII